MTLYHRFDTLTNTRGDSLVAHRVIVRAQNAGAQQPLYGDLGGTPIVNTSGIADTAITDDNGNFSYYINPSAVYDEEYYSPAGVFLFATRNIPMLAGIAGPQGDTGPAASTYTTKTSLIAAPVSNGSYIFAPPSGADSGLAAGTFLYQTANAPYTEDGVNIVKLSSVSLSTGALVRQAATGINFDGRSASAKLLETVSVKDARFAGGAKGDGASDDTSPFQAAQDALPNGGIIIVPPGTYSVSNVNIANRNITIQLDSAATIIRRGSAGVALRGMFAVSNLLNANFTVTGGTADLNGEGPIGIAITGRIVNTYADQTVAGIKAISGPANSLVYAVRSSGITIRNTKIRNTGESAVLFRNCASTLVDNVDFTNCANFGVEYNYPLPANDGGTGTLPTLGDHAVTNCTFTDINDYGMGTGNGVGVGGGGNAGGLGAIGSHRIRNVKFFRCQRDIHFEFATGTWIEPLLINGVDSKNAGQGSFGGIGVRNVSITDYTVLNPCSAATGALIAMIRSTSTPSNWPSLYGTVFSADYDRISLSEIKLIDNRTNPIRSGTTGTTTANSTAFSATGANFVSTDVGQEIAIAGAGPSGIPHICRIDSVNSATSVTLSRPAVAAVSGAMFAWGGAMRVGQIFANGVGGAVTKCRVEGGISSGLTNEPDASAIQVGGLTGDLMLANNKWIAPASTGTRPTGLRMLAQSGGTITPRDNTNTGFATRYVGIDAQRSSVRAAAYNSPNHTAINASSTANTDGAEMAFNPTADHFLRMSDMFLAFNDNGSSETVTVTLTAYRYDGNVNTLTVTNNTPGDSSRALSGQETWLLNQANAPIRYLGVKMRSSIANSITRLFVRFGAIQE